MVLGISSNKGYGFSMTHPAEKARIHIMKGLEACQSDPSLADTMENLVQALAKAQSKLFPAIKLPADSAGSIDMMRRSMDYLAHALKILQDITSESETVQIAATSIAKSLQTLHPLVEEAKTRASQLSLPPVSSTKAGSEMHVDVNTALSMNTDHQFYSGFSEDIEEGGIFVATFDLKPIDASVIVNFRLSADYPITAKGVVHWVREYNPLTPDVPPGMGVKFTDLLPEDKKAIENHLKTRATLFYDDE